VTQADERAAQFVSVTLADTEEIWTEIFETQVGDNYKPTTLALFKGATQSPCGGATAQQRQRLFETGYESAQVASCDTFGTNNL
jgi:predicted metalloprotease